MDTFGLKIISSDRVFYEGRCRKMIVPVPDGGGMEILPHHEDMVIAVVIGEAMLQFEEGEWVNLAVGAGFLEIVNNRVTMLVQTAEKPEDIDARHAQEQMEYAEEKLRQKQSIQEYYRTQASLSRAMNRLKVSKRKKMVNRKQIYVEARNLLQIARFFNTEFLTKFIGKNGTIFYKIKVPIQGSLW